MKVLILTRFFPNDPSRQTHGVYGRLRTLVRGVAESGAVPFILYYVDNPDDLESQPGEWTQRLSDYYGVGVTYTLASLSPVDRTVRNTYAGVFKGALSWRYQDAFYRSFGEQQRLALERALGDADLLLVHRLNCMPPVVAQHVKLPPVMLDLDDIEHLALVRALLKPPHWLSKHLQWLHIPALRSAESRAAKLATRTLVCSEVDQVRLQRQAGVGSVSVLPNSVAVPAQVPLPEAPVFLFIGTYAYEPNVRAAEWLIDSIWPRIIAAVPNATLLIAGNHPESIRQFKSPPLGVEFTGFVADLGELYARTRVVVCPVLSGSGTRVKLVEAAAHARPAVSTTIGAEGLAFKNGQEILLADEPEAFAAACVALVHDQERAQAMADAAYSRARSEYDQQTIVKRLVNWIREDAQHAVQDGK